MINRLRFVFLVCIVAGLAGAPVNAAEVSAPAEASSAAAPAAGHQWRGDRLHLRSEFRRVLSKLNLTPEQTTQIKAILARAKIEIEPRRAHARASREALATMSPNDPGYPALVATEKANAAVHVQTASDLTTQIYSVLPPDQQARIPALRAEDRCARGARMATWRSQHAG